MNKMRDDNIYSVYLYTTVVCCNYSRTDKWIPFCPNTLTGYGPETLLGYPDIHPTWAYLSLSCRRIHVDYNSRISPLLF